MLGYRLQVPGINIYDGQVLNLRIVCDYLRPRTRTQPNHQNVRGTAMKCTEGVGPNDYVGVIQQVNFKLSIVNSTSEERGVRGDADHATSVFDDVSKVFLWIECLEQQAIIDRRKHRFTHRGDENCRDARDSECDFPPCRWADGSKKNHAR